MEWNIRLSGEQSAWNVTMQGQEIVASPFLFLMLLIEPNLKSTKLCSVKKSRHVAYWTGSWLGIMDLLKTRCWTWSWQMTHDHRQS